MAVMSLLSDIASVTLVHASAISTGMSMFSSGLPHPVVSSTTISMSPDAVRVLHLAHSLIESMALKLIVAERFMYAAN